MVRLKEGRDEAEVGAHCLFQFQYGSIKSSARLQKEGAIRAFQFQYGSIKRKNRNAKDYDSEEVSIPIWFD